MLFQKVRDKVTEPVKNVATLAIAAIVLACLAIVLSAARLVK